MDWIGKKFGFAVKQTLIEEQSVKTAPLAQEEIKATGKKYKDTLKLAVAKYLHFKTEEERQQKFIELFEQIKAELKDANAQQVIESQLDLRALSDLTMKIIHPGDFDTNSKPNIRISQMLILKYDQMVSAMECFNFVLTASADYLWSCTDYNKFSKTVNSIVWKYSLLADEIEFQNQFPKQHQILINEILIFFEKLTHLNDPHLVIDFNLFYRIAFETQNEWSICAAQVISIFMATSKFTDEIMEVSLNVYYEHALAKFLTAVNKKDGTKALTCLIIVIASIKVHCAYKRIQIQEIQPFFRYLKKKMTIALQYIWELSRCGSENLFDLVDTNPPFQRSDFSFPEYTEAKSFRNRKVIEIFRFFYFTVESPKIIGGFAELIKSNPCNYFLVNSSSTIMLEMIEGVSKVSPAISSITLDILRYLVYDLKYTPFKELTILFSQFHQGCHSDTKMQNLALYLEFLKRSSFWILKFRELGLVSILAEHICHVLEAVEKNNLDEWVITTFDKTIELLTLLIFDSENLKEFRARVPQSLMPLFSVPALCSGSLKLIKHLCITSTMKIHPELSLLMEFIVNTDFLLKIQLLQVLDEVLFLSSTIKAIFKNSKGYERLCDILESTLKLDCNYDDQQYQDFLIKWTNLLISSLQGSFYNSQYFNSDEIQQRIGRVLGQFFQIQSFRPLICGCLFSIILEEKIMMTGFSKCMEESNLTRIEELCTDILIRNIGPLIILISFLKDKDKSDDKISKFIFYAIYIMTDNKKNQFLLCNNQLGKHMIHWIIRCDICSFEVDNMVNLKLCSVPQLALAIISRIFSIGISTAELRTLLTEILNNTSGSLKSQFLLDLLLRCLTETNAPPYFQFTNSLGQGYITLGDYERSFPPLSGYTFMAWIQVQHYDEQEPITIIDIQDLESQSFLQISLEDKRVLLKTIKGSQKFEEEIPTGKWTHIAIVHQKPRIQLIGSTVSFYINGQFKGTHKCGYLGQPGSVGQVNTYIGGTPQKKSVKSSSIFQLGPTYLFEEHLLEAPVINVVYEIGYEYTGSWQGSWSKYLIGNELLRFKAAQLSMEEARSPVGRINYVLNQGKQTIPTSLGVPIDKILISLCAKNTTGTFNEVWNANTESKAQFKKCSIGTLHGNVLINAPKRLVDSLWTLGGTSVLLKLVELSDSPDSLYRSLSLVTKCIKESWRLSSEMENNQLYEILSSLVRSKKQFINISIMDMLMALAGKTLGDSENAIISNSSALRYLILDIEMWKTSKELQKYFLSQFSDLVIYSRFKEDNIEKLISLSIIKRFILMLGSQIIYVENLDEFMVYLKLFLIDGWCPEVTKAICSYLILTLPSVNDFSEVKQSINNGSSQFAKMEVAIMKSKEIEHQSYEVQARNKIMKILLELMEDEYSGRKVASDILRHMSAKWISLFWGPRIDAHSFVLAAKFYCRIQFLVHDSMETGFQDGPIVLAKLLQSHFNLIELYPIIMASISGVCVSRELLDIPSFEIVLEECKSFNEKSPKTVKMLIPMLSLISNAGRVISDGQNVQNNLESLSKVLDKTIPVILKLVQQIDSLKALACKKDIAEKLVGVLLNTIAMNENYTLEKELSQLKAMSDKEITMDQLFHSRIDESQLKLQLIFHGDSSNTSAFYLAAKSLVDGIKGKQVSSSYFGLAPTNHSKPLLSYQQALTENMIELLVTIAVDSLFNLDFDRFEGILRSLPPVSMNIMSSYTELFLLLVMDSVNMQVTKKPSLIHDSRNLQSYLKLITTIVEEVYIGTFTDKGTMLAFDFVTYIIYQLNEIEEQQKSSSFQISGFWKQLNRITTYLFANIDVNGGLERKLGELLDKIQTYQVLFLNQKNLDSEFLKIFIFKCYQYLFRDSNIQTRALSIWKLLLNKKPQQVHAIIKGGKGNDAKDIVDGFSKILFSQSSFSEWLTSRQHEVSAIFNDLLLKSWENYESAELKNVKDAIRLQRHQRILRLKKVYKKRTQENEIFNAFMEKSKNLIQESKQLESSKLAKFKQDYEVMQATINSEWQVLSEQLERERSVWDQKAQNDVNWMLDFTEGRSRMRKKLRSRKYMANKYLSKEEATVTLAPKKSRKLLEKTISIPDEANLSNDDPFTVVSPPGIEENEEEEEEGEIIQESLPEIDIDNEWEQVVKQEDQNRNISRLLDQGDEIVEIFNCGRLLGIQLWEGLSVIGKKNLYIINNYFQRSDGEILEIKQVPMEERNIYNWTVSSSNHKNFRIHDNPHEYHACRRSNYDDVREVHKRLYLFRNVAVEIFMSDGRNFFLTFDSQKARDTVYQRILSKASFNQAESVSGVASNTNQLQAVFSGSPLSDLTQKWCNREISNMAYLMSLNTLAGRSYNDLTQYPTFPWVLSDYSSETLDLDNPSSFRDLSKPMGGQGEKRAKEFDERFKSWDDTIPACHYGTHYSSSMIVCSFLIRIEPFTKEYLNLQGGAFDHTDRLFHSIPTSWASASKLNTTDVRELIPEFYYLTEFLTNENKYDFGKKQTGESVDDVILPTWANNDPRLFIQLHRQALESEYVSANLNNWIDLIFGFKQQGDEAARNLNVFHYLSYEGAVDIDKIDDPIEKQAAISIIHNFGQTPRQLFKKPHPKRKADDAEQPWTLMKNCKYLIKSLKPIKNLGLGEISDIKLTDKVIAVGPRAVMMPPNYVKYVDWLSKDNTVRLVGIDHKTIATFENLHIGSITCAAFANQNILVTGGEDNNVCIWSWSSKKTELESICCMRGHQREISCLAVSRAFSIIVSGGKDNSCIIWDLNRYQYVRCLEHDDIVQAVTINENTGDIASATKDKIHIWTINGKKICSKNVSSEITTIAFLDGKPNEVFHTKVILSGHSDGTIKIWELAYMKRWTLELLNTLEQNKAYPITFIQVSNRFLLAGDSKGDIFSYTFPDGSGSEIHFQYDESCKECDYHYLVLDRKGNCKGCGATVCVSCLHPTNFKNMQLKLCNSCNSIVEGLAHF